MISSTRAAGIRPLAMRMPSALRRDFANSLRPDVLPDHQGRRAVRVERAADVLEVLLAEQVPVLDTERRERRLRLGAGLVQLDDATLPSSSLVMSTRSSTRMVPESWSSLMAGMISPENLFPGNAIAMYSTGPMLMP